MASAKLSQTDQHDRSLFTLCPVPETAAKPAESLISLRRLMCVLLSFLFLFYVLHAYVFADASQLVHGGASGPVRGVNLGSWLVLEPYMSPSLFKQFNTTTLDAAVDEYEFCKISGYEEAEAQLKAHWDSWYQEEDIAAFAASGINTLRLPVGYWAFNKLPNQPWVTGQQKYIDLAISWAQKYKMNFWIDLHGALGSQNGFDNSGKRGDVHWGSKESVKHTLDTLQIIVNRYGKNPGVTGIELLNEPYSITVGMDIVTDFHQRAYEIVKPTGKLIIIHDAFQQAAKTYTKFPVAKYPNAALDVHFYHVFVDNEINLVHKDRLQLIRNRGAELARDKRQTSMPIIVGEWSAANTDCATWLNGIGIGTRFEGTMANSTGKGNCKGKNMLEDMTAAELQQIKEIISTTVDTFEASTDGWIFWAGKTESADLWSFQTLFNAGLFPDKIGQPSAETKVTRTQQVTKVQPFLKEHARSTATTQPTVRSSATITLSNGRAMINAMVLCVLASALLPFLI